MASARARARTQGFGWLCAWLGAAIAAFSAGAQADSGPEQQVALSWSAPAAAECASAEQMRARVARLSDLPLTLGTSAAAYRVEVIVSASADTWQADVRMLDAEARTLRVRNVRGRTPSCGSIDVAAAVVIATMLDSVRIRAHEEHVRSADGGRLSLGAFAAFSPALIPEAWLGAGLSLEAGADIPVAFSASVYAPADHTDSRGRGARIWGFHAGASLCPAAIRSSSLDLQLCAGAQAGAVFASGVDLTQSADAIVPLLLLQAGPKLTFKVTRTFALQLAAAAAWAFVRPEISWDIQGEPQALTGSRIALLAQLGITISPW